MLWKQIGMVVRHISFSSQMPTLCLFALDIFWQRRSDEITRKKIWEKEGRGMVVFEKFEPVTVYPH